MRANRFVKLGVIGLVIGSMFAVAPAASAKGGDGVERRGSCSGAADWKIRLRPEDGNTLEIEFEVEHAKAGQSWSVSITDNGTSVFQGSRTANALRRFEVRTVTSNRAGSDHVVAKATNKVTGQVCNASATL